MANCQFDPGLAFPGSSSHEYVNSLSASGPGELHFSVAVGFAGGGSNRRKSLLVKPTSIPARDSSGVVRGHEACGVAAGRLGMAIGVNP